jgi:methylmalonyl-CoA mutase, C-terminal domain
VSAIRRHRVLVAKPGLDGHDRGARIVSMALRDAGFEVIYTGLFNTPEQVAAIAVQEDVDAVGLSILSGAHMHNFISLRRLLDEKGAEEMIIFGGGIIPDDDVAALKEQGISGVFTPGSSTKEIVSWLRTKLSEQAGIADARSESLGASHERTHG